MDSAAEEIAKLATLRQRGVISEREFKRQKRRLTAGEENRRAPWRTAGVAGLVVACALAALVFLVANKNKQPHDDPHTSGATVRVKYASVTTTQVQQAINWATSHVNDDFDSGACLNFVYLAWQAAGVDIGGYFPSDDPVTYWAHDYGGYFEHASPGVYNDPPPGALVFWGATGWNSSGHVALSLGNNQVVSTSAYPYAGRIADSPLVFTFNLSQRSPTTYNYLGWMLPGDIVSTPAPPAPTPTQPGPPGTSGLQAGTPPGQSSPPTSPGVRSGSHGSSPVVPTSAATKSPPAGPPLQTARPSPTPEPKSGGQPSAPGPPASPATAALPTTATTWSETTGGVTHTWTDYSDAGGNQGPSIPSNATVQIACRVQGFQVADGNTWWYKIASAPWDNGFYASADAFYNNGQTSGSLVGTPFVDPNVATC